MLKVLFSSNDRVKILSLFVANPKNRYYLREIPKLIQSALRPVQRELKKLESAGLLKKIIEGNRTYYEINTDHYIYPELKTLVLKTTGFGALLKTALLKEKEVECAFIYGSYAENKETAKSDIDLFVIGNISDKKLQSIFTKYAHTYGRELNSVLYSPDEFAKKRNGHFISSVLKKPKIMLKGDVNAV